mgnify:CR=1 FL=1
MNITEIKSEIAGDSYYKVAHATAVLTQNFP